MIDIQFFLHNIYLIKINVSSGSLLFVCLFVVLKIKRHNLVVIVCFLFLLNSIEILEKVFFWLKPCENDGLMIL